jgi:hypothetical protein
MIMYNNYYYYYYYISVGLDRLNHDLSLSLKNRIPVEKCDVDLANDVKITSDNSLTTLNNLLQYDKLDDGSLLLLLLY